MERCDSLRTVTTGFLVVHPPLPPVASVFVSPLRPDADLGPGALVAATPTPLVKWSRRASQVPGEPWCAYAVFSDPGGTRSSGITVIQLGPRTANAEGYPRVRQSRGSIARLQHWLSTLRSGHHWPPRKTRFRLPARLYRMGLVTHRIPTKGFRDALVTSLPPFPSFAWRNGCLPWLYLV
jgi:hypothetical protein